MPDSIKLIVSILKLEKVVKPPKKPINIAARHKGLKPNLSINNVANTPINNDPKTLIVKIP